MELLDRHKSWILLLASRQIPPRELNVPKCCAETGIHTFLCILTTFPSGQKQHNWMERRSSTACHWLSPANNQRGVPHEWAVFLAEKKVGFWSTPPSQLCSKDLAGGCEIQCKTWDGDGFIPVWEAKAHTTVFLTISAPTWMHNYIPVSKLLCLLLVSRSLLFNAWLCWSTKGNRHLNRLPPCFLSP